MIIPVDGPEVNVFEAVGGRPFFDRVVERFYAGVETDPVLRPLYPEDLTESIRHTAGFLAQYWGGGTAQYSDERGHPRLRMRHGHVAIDRAGRDRWVHHMTEAVRAEHLPEELQHKLLAYFEMGATAMVNVAD
ncbi:MAG: globin [Acidimicrobiales bacterium]|nr:globin [Acidimicrobiales bacterium]